MYLTHPFNLLHILHFSLIKVEMWPGVLAAVFGEMSSGKQDGGRTSGGEVSGDKIGWIPYRNIFRSNDPKFKFLTGTTEYQSRNDLLN